MSDQTEQLADDYREHMLEKANVVGISGGEDGLLVLVTRKVPLETLSAMDVVDPEVEGVSTDVIEVGDVRPMVLKAGDSIGLSGAGTGTLGGIVTDEAGNLYALTNNHVAANSNKALALSPVHHPGAADGLGGRIGVLARFEPIYFDRANAIDAALVRLDVNDFERTHSPDTTTARVGWRVKKHGRTSGYSKGKVIGRNTTIDVNFGEQGVARFVGQIITDHMLDPGDSGSVLLSTSSHPCGLGFAGSDTISIHTPINLVLRTLAVRFAE